LAQAAAERADDTGGEQSQINIGRCRAYTRSAALVREHLCAKEPKNAESLGVDFPSLRTATSNILHILKGTTP